jgi:flagellar biogenesis protein FliO
MVLVFGLLGAAVWALRRKTAGLKLPLRVRVATRTQRLESAGRLGLTAHHALHIVRFGEVELLVVTHPQGCTLLAEKSDAGGEAPARSL